MAGESMTARKIRLDKEAAKMRDANRSTVNRRAAAFKRYRKAVEPSGKVVVACPIATACASVERIISDAQAILIPALPVESHRRIAIGRTILSAFVSAAHQISHALDLKEEQCRRAN